MDTGDSFLCTPDHPLYRTNLKKVKASKSLGRSLVSANFHEDKDGYLYTTYGSRLNSGIMGERLNRVVGAQYLGNIANRHVHHIDENVINNNPENLKALLPKEHYEEHPEKLRTWTRYLEVSASSKSDMMKDMNSDTSLARERLLGKAYKVGVRVLHSGLQLEEDSFNLYMMQGGSNWETTLQVADMEDVEFIDEVTDYYNHIISRINKGFSKEAKYLKTCMSYTLRSKADGVFGKSSSELEMKRLFSKGYAALDILGLKKVVSVSALRKRAEKKGVKMPIRALARVIDLEEFMMCYLGGSDPMALAYKDQSDKAKFKRAHLYDLALYSERSLKWNENITQRLYADFIRKINAMMEKGLDITHDNFHNEYKNACGQSSWHSGFIAAKKLGLTKKQVLADAKTANHKVVKVEDVTYEKAVPVYDLVIPNDHNYRLDCGIFAGNTHGIGIKALNAVSIEFSVWTFREKSWWHTSYAKGVEQVEVAKAKAPDVPFVDRPKHGTVIYAELDPSVFDKGSKVDPNEIESWFTTTSYFTDGVTLLYTDAKGNQKEWEGQSSEDTLLADVEHLKASLLEDDAYLVASDKFFDFALAFTDYDGAHVQGYAAGLHNEDGGTHVNTVYKVVSDVVSAYANRKHKFNPTDLRDGLVGSINVKLSAIKFHNQEKTKLVDERCGQPLYDELFPIVESFFKKNKQLAVTMCERASRINDLKADFKANKAVLKVFKEQKKRAALPSKLVSSLGCSNEERELYVVEGDSAGGCFDGETHVLLADGSSISFLDMVEGAKHGKTYEVVSYDQQKRDFVTAVAEFPRETKRVRSLVELTFGDNSFVRCTPCHLFLTNRGWVRAGSLTINDSIVSKNGVQRIWLIVEVTAVDNVPVYDLTVPKYHNFVLSNGAVVHNSARRARDSKFQEVLPLKGKIKNPFNQSATDSEELLSLLMAIGYDPTKENPAETLRVGKLILLTDADVDGLHIQTLVLGAILAYVPEMFVQGRVYSCLPYEYVGFHKGQAHFALTIDELKDAIPSSAVGSIMHLKGWGEVDADILSDMAFNRDKRRLYKIVPESINNFARTTRSLMESEGSAQRKKLLGLE